MQEQSQNTWSVALEDTFHADAGGRHRRRRQLRQVRDHQGRGVQRDARASSSIPRAARTRSTGRARSIWRYSQSGRGARQRVRSRALPGDLRAVQHALRHRDAESGSRSGARHQSRSRLEGRAPRTRASRGRRVLQRRPGSDPDRRAAGHHDADAERRRRAVLRRGSRRSTRTVGTQLRVGGNYTAISRTIHDALQPNLRPTGVPTHKAFLYAAWRPIERLTITPSLDVAGDRWSDVNPAPRQLPYVRTGGYTLVNLAAEYAVASDFDVVLRLQEPDRRQLRAGVGLPAARPHVLLQDPDRSVIRCDGIDDARDDGCPPIVVPASAWRCCLRRHGRGGAGPPAPARRASTLSVGGDVATPLTLTPAELKALPRTTRRGEGRGRPDGRATKACWSARS